MVFISLRHKFLIQRGYRGLNRGLPAKMAFTYARLTKTMNVPSSHRDPKEVLYLEPWFRMKSNFLKDLPQGKHFWSINISMKYRT